MLERRERKNQPFRVLEGGLDFEIRASNLDIRISLSGTLDTSMLERIKAALQTRLNKRGMRVVLDGKVLDHVDYRAVPGLLAWHAHLKSFGHDLSLSGWSPTHKTILLLGYHNVDNTERTLNGRVSVV